MQHTTQHNTLRAGMAAVDAAINPTGPTGVLTGWDAKGNPEYAEQTRPPAPTAENNQPTTKQTVLGNAMKAVGDRGLNYGKPEDNFERIAARWRAHLRNRFGQDIAIDAASVAVMMSDVKLARIEHMPNHPDSWVDLAGYAACGGEITANY